MSWVHDLIYFRVLNKGPSTLETRRGYRILVELELQVVCELPQGSLGNELWSSASALHPRVISPVPRSVCGDDAWATQR